MSILYKWLVLVLCGTPLSGFFEDDTCESKLVGTFSVILYCIYLRKKYCVFCWLNFANWLLTKHGKKNTVF